MFSRLGVLNAFSTCRVLSLVMDLSGWNSIPFLGEHLYERDFIMGISFWDYGSSEVPQCAVHKWEKQESPHGLSTDWMAAANTAGRSSSLFLNSSVNLFQKHPHRHIQKCLPVIWASLNSVRLTSKINNHTGKFLYIFYDNKMWSEFSYKTDQTNVEFSNLFWKRPIP